MSRPVRHDTHRLDRGERSESRLESPSGESLSMQPTAVREPVRSGNHPGLAWDHVKLAHTILDDDAFRIFRSASGEPVTAAELSRRCGIPIARCYRWLRKLQSLGLISFVESRPGSHGIRTRFYTSTLRSLSVRIEDGGIRTRVEVNGGSTPLVTECMTMTEASETAGVPEDRPLRHAGRTNVVHFVDTPRSQRSRRRRLPIHLPALPEASLPRPPERR
jgi:hypothetical protein